MKIAYGINQIEIKRPTIVTLGIFDGLHLGHQKIMQLVVERAKATGFVPTVLTFSPDPRAVLHPQSAPPLLHTFEQKAEGLEILGIEQLVVLEFTCELASISAEDFTRKILYQGLEAKEVYLGQGFAFGRGREGNFEKLKEFSHRFDFFADEVPEISLRTIRISSSKIRSLLISGQVNLARRMLGRPYGVEGIVLEGRQLGRQIQFPTANLMPQNAVLPANGVYVTLTLIEGVWRRSVTNVGIRPTFKDLQDRLVESHILNFDGDLYGKTLRVRFLHRLRAEKKFASLDELKKQISLDSNRAEKYFQHQIVGKVLKFV
ncbi:MAG: bifunctional riboflavin kinase/FAD synthetase [Blastocatellia bacterium]|nr:bifunctional riboflavin kinase/FAD synthetase [Blastocatellia bacterium]